MRFIHTNVFFVLFILSASLSAQVNVIVESGLVKTGYNKIKIPTSTGTLLNLHESFNTKPKPFIRASLAFSLFQNHNVVLLYAPLSVMYSGELLSDTYFNDYKFMRHERVKAVYRFDSYRVTYAYRFLNKKAFELKVGITAKIRDAEFFISNDDHKEPYYNTGFVALFHLDLKYNLNERLNFNFVGDGLAVKYGRAEDFLFSIDYNISNKLSTYAGYRILEGGSDGSSVYTFALFHYGVIGVELEF